MVLLTSCLGVSHADFPFSAAASGLNVFSAIFPLELIKPSVYCVFVMTNDIEDEIDFFEKASFN